MIYLYSTLLIFFPPGEYDRQTSKEGTYIQVAEEGAEEERLWLSLLPLPLPLPLGHLLDLTSGMGRDETLDMGMGDRGFAG